MVLNYIWIAFFFLAFAMAVYRSLVMGEVAVWSDIMSSSFSSAATAFEISIGLTGVLALWLGLMKIGERAGVVRFFGRMISPLFCRLFPGVPKDHPAMGSVFMNVSANMLGLDNAATPLGLKAMQELQTLNPRKDTDVFLPILLATFISTMVGIVALCLRQRIRLLDPVLLTWLLGMAAVIFGTVWVFSGMEGEAVERWSGFVANFLLFSVIIAFMGAGLVKRVNMYEAFIEGAREGFRTAVTIIPYLVAILVAIGMFRASGAMALLTDGITAAVAFFGFDTQWVGALPTMLMKPLSGSGSCAMMLDVMKAEGPDVFVSRLAAVVRGSTDTTFYILAVYFGSVGVVKTRYAAGYALLADAVGAIAAVMIAYLFWN